MGSRVLTTDSALKCPHQGTISAVCSNDKARSGGFVLRSSDTFTISGCTLTTPGGTPIPCLTVRWVLSDTKVKVLGSATLSEASMGLCLNAAQAPQGSVLVMLNAQARVETV